MWKKFKTLWPFGKNSPSYQEKTVILHGEAYLLREVLTSDIKELLQVERLVYAGRTPWPKAAFLSELYSRYVHQYLCLVAVDRIIGFIGLRIAVDDGHVTHVAVIPAYQGRGIGRFLMNEAEKFAREQACRSLSLEVRVSNLAAQSLYGQLGYEVRRVLPAYYSEGQEDALDMVKYLK